MVTDSDGNLEPWPEGGPPTIGAQKASKLQREIRHLWERIAAAGVTTVPALALIKEADVSAETPAKDHREVLARCKALRFYVKGAEAAKGVKSPPDDDGSGGDDEADPPKPEPPLENGNGKTSVAAP